MSISIIREPNEYSFSGNPMIFKLVSDTNDLVDVLVTFAGQSVPVSYNPFNADGGYIVEFDISGIISHAPGNLMLPGGGIVQGINGFVLDYTVAINGSYTFSGKAFRGGISKQAYIQLERMYYDMFTFRLNAPYSNFLFTTRTNGHEITIRETELYPFIFIGQGLPLHFRSAVSGNAFATGALTKGEMYALDVKAVRDKFDADFGEVPAIIEVRSDNEDSFRFVVVPGVIAEEKYIIRFINSLGAPELVEVSGRLFHVPEAAEENAWQSLSSDGIFEEKRSRTGYRQVMEVETGYKTRNEYSFIQDMILSDEIYFIWPDGREYRCHVSVDEMRFGHRLITPNSVLLTVRMVYDESFVTPDITGVITEGDGIFDDSHDNPFE